MAFKGYEKALIERTTMGKRRILTRRRSATRRFSVVCMKKSAHTVMFR